MVVLLIIELNVNPKPNANAGSNVSYCYGMAGSVGVAPVAGYTYSWAPITGLSSATIANPTVNVMTSEMYILTVTDINGCFDKDSVQVNMLPLPQVSAGSDVIIALGNSTTLNASGASGYTFINAGNYVAVPSGSYLKVTSRSSNTLNVINNFFFVYFYGCSTILIMIAFADSMFSA